MDITLPASLRAHLRALAETHPNAAHARATMEQTEAEVCRAIEHAVLAEQERCAGLARVAATALRERFLVGNALTAEQIEAAVRGGED